MRMLGGVGMESYTRNSAKQALAFSLVAPVLKDAILTKGFGFDSKKCRLVCIADFGCATGNNTIVPMRFVADTVRQREGAGNVEIQAFFSDLNSNDFSTLFKQLEESSSALGCFFAAVPGSFYGRLLPSSSLHIALCNISLHWLSKVMNYILDLALLLWSVQKPGNTGKKIASGQFTTTNDAFATQAHEDFCRFLSCRAQEMVPHGILSMIVLADARCEPKDISFEDWYVTRLELTWTDMLMEGLIDEKTHGSLRIPWFFRTVDDVVKANVDTGEEFNIIALEQSKYLAAPVSREKEGSSFQDSINAEVAFCKNITVGSIAQHLRNNDFLVNEFYRRLRMRFIKDDPCNIPELISFHVAVVVMKRN